MIELILTEEQTRQLLAAQGRVKVKTPGGQELGKIDRPLTDEEIAALKARAKDEMPEYSSEQVQARMKALEAEWERTGGFDPTHLERFFDQLSQDDQDSYGPLR